MFHGRSDEFVAEFGVNGFKEDSGEAAINRAPSGQSEEWAEVGPNPDPSDQVVVGKVPDHALKHSTQVDLPHEGNKRSMSSVIGDCEMDRFLTCEEGYESSRKFVSSVSSAARLRDGFWKAPTIAVHGEHVVRPLTPLGETSFTHRVMQLGPMLTNVLVPNEKGAYMCFLPLKFEPYVGEFTLVSDGRIARRSGKTLYQLFCGKYAVCESTAPFLRLDACFGEYASFAVRENFCIAEARVMHGLREGALCAAAIPEELLFGSAVSLCERQGWPMDFQFYTECFDWIGMGLGDDVDAYLMGREADHAPLFLDEEPEMTPKEYLLALMDELERCNAPNSVHLRMGLEDALLDEELTAQLAMEVSQGMMRMSLHRSEGYLEPVKAEEPSEGSVMSYRESLDGQSRITVDYDFGTSTVKTSAKVLGRYPLVFAGNSLHVKFGSASLDNGLCQARERQLAGGLDMMFVEFSGTLPGSVSSLSTRSHSHAQGFCANGAAWQERGEWRFHYIGPWFLSRSRRLGPVPPDLAEAEALLARAVNNQFVSELIYRGAQPGKISVLAAKGLRAFSPSHVLGRSCYLDSFSLSENVALVRPLVDPRAPSPFGDDRSLGSRGVARHWMFGFMGMPEHFVFELDSHGTSLNPIMVIRSGGKSKSFSVRFGMAVECFDPALDPDENYLRMVCGPGGEVLRRASSSKGVVSLASALAARDLTGDFAPPRGLPTPDAEEMSLFLQTLTEEGVGPGGDFVTRTARIRGGARGNRAAGNAVPRRHEWGEESTKAIDVFINQLPLTPDPIRGAKVVAQVRRAQAQKLARGARTMTTKWSDIVQGSQVSVTKMRQLEADLRDVVMGWGSERQLEEMDPRVLFVFMQDGPMFGLHDPIARRDPRMPVKLRLAGQGSTLRDFAARKVAARDALREGELSALAPS